MKPLILIADAAKNRAEEVAAVLSERGYGVVIAEHGVEALERALRDGPKLVIAPHGLPLVDAPRLAEIVGSNPRTRDVRFLFLGEADASSRVDLGIGDEQIPATLRPDDIAEAACELLERQDRIADFAAITGKGERGCGSLAELSLADLIQLLHAGRKSGVLEVDTDHTVFGPVDGAIWVRNGEIIDARTGSAEREKALFRMLSWKTGDFSFGPGSPDHASPLSHVRHVSRIEVPTRALLAEGLRQLQEWNRLATRLPTPDASIRLAVAVDDLPAAVHPLTREVLAQLQIHPQVADVVDHCSYPDYQVLRTLHTLEERGLIALARTHSPAVANPTTGVFSPPQARRLLEWAREAQGRPREVANVRLIVSASSPTAVADFANLLRPIPGVSLSAEMERGEIGEDDLLVLGTVRVDDRLSIELVHVPSIERFAPFWARAAHDSLGVLFLLSGAVGEAVERLAPMSQTVRSLPRARVFHAALLAKGDRLSPDELRENLELFDEASLFLLPLEAAKVPGTLVAKMFARLVP